MIHPSTRGACIEQNITGGWHGVREELELDYRLVGSLFLLLRLRLSHAREGVPRWREEKEEESRSGVFPLSLPPSFFVLFPLACFGAVITTEYEIGEPGGGGGFNFGSCV